MTFETPTSFLIPTGLFQTNCIVAGEGPPLLLLHGSGPGVTALANWQGVLPHFSASRKVAAPDLLGFGSTERATDQRYDFMATWTNQVLALLDALEFEHVDIIGNSFGGGVALAFAALYPERVRRLVLMGSAGAPTPLTDALDHLWGYQPSLQAMRTMLSNLVADQSRITDELVALRHNSSLQSGAQDAYAALFPAPRQRWLDALSLDDAALAAIHCPTLLLHGRDDRVIPLASSLYLNRTMPNAQLTVFDDCGHWVMVERSAAFLAAVTDFFDRD